VSGIKGDTVDRANETLQRETWARFQRHDGHADRGITSTASDRNRRMRTQMTTSATVHSAPSITETKRSDLHVNLRRCTPLDPPLL